MQAAYGAVLRPEGRDGRLELEQKDAWPESNTNDASLHARPNEFGDPMATLETIRVLIGLEAIGVPDFFDCAIKALCEAFGKSRRIMTRCTAVAN
jgi:hypothetical protein